MLSNEIVDCLDIGEHSPASSAIYTLGQSVMDHYVRSFSACIEYVYSDSFKPLSDVPSSTAFLSSTGSEETSVVIETFILDEICSVHHRDELISAFVCEQWIIRHSKESLPGGDAISWNKALVEIETYFKSSPLSFWLKEHFQSKPFKLTHRLCYSGVNKAQLGIPFLTTLSELLERVITASGQAAYYFTPNDGPLKIDSCILRKGPHPLRSHMYHTFPPICLRTGGFLNLTVVSPERMPPGTPECPFCISDCQRSNNPPILPKNVSASTEQGKHHVDSPELSEHFAHPTVNERLRHSIRPADHISLTNESDPLKHLACNPIIVSMKADRNVSNRSGYPEYDLPLFGHPESATSTLTKKPKSSKTNGPLQAQLDSPPRKQQRTSDQSYLSPYHEQCSELSPLANRVGTLDMVIADFTHLNMELSYVSLEDILATNNAICPSVGLNDRGKSVSEIESFGSTGIVDQPRRVKNETNLGRSLSSRIDNGHLPRERRRNAVSSCVPAWSSGFPSNGSVVFNRRTGLPLQSSPVPLKRSTSGRFDFDSSLSGLKSAKSSICMLGTCSHLTRRSSELDEESFPSCDSSVCSAQLCRRRPTSLRLNSSKPVGQSKAVLSSCSGYPTHTTEVNQAEISCSAPPSVDRNAMRAILNHDRMVNTLACTPVSYSSSQHLLVNFEESMLNGRIHPIGQVDGFTLVLGASGSFFPAHERLPLITYFFDLSDDNKPSPYLGYADLSHLRNGKGYHIPLKGSVQLTLFNPNKFVVKMFVIGYDFEDMPPNSQTFLRQRTLYMPVQSRRTTTTAVDASWYCGSSASLNEVPVDGQNDNHSQSTDRLSLSDMFWDSSRVAPSQSPAKSSSTASSCSCSSLSSVCSGLTTSHLTLNSTNSLRYLVHLRFHTTRSGRLYLHTDLRLIFAREKFEFDPGVSTYELRSLVDAPTNPRYSPKKWAKRPRPGAITSRLPS